MWFSIRHLSIYRFRLHGACQHPRDTETTPEKYLHLITDMWNPSPLRAWLKDLTAGTILDELECGYQCAVFPIIPCLFLIL